MSKGKFKEKIKPFRVALTKMLLGYKARHVLQQRRGAMETIQRYFKGAIERRRDANSAMPPPMAAPPSRTAVVGTTEIQEKTMLDDMVADSPPRKGLNKTGMSSPALSSRSPSRAKTSNPIPKKKKRHK